MPKKPARRGPTPAVEITLDEHERSELESFAKARSLPHSLVARAKNVLLAADGEDNLRISKRVGLNRISVGKWRRRYADEGLPT
jgi:putative transposase